MAFIMEFRHVTLSVKDIEKSLSFYTDIVGLELIRRFPVGSDTEIAFLGSGGTEVELIWRSSSDPVINPSVGISMGFMASSLEDTISLLREKGYETDGIIQSPNPNTSFFFARDPDGYNIQFLKV